MFGRNRGYKIVSAVRQFHTQSKLSTMFMIRSRVNRQLSKVKKHKLNFRLSFSKKYLQ